MLQKILVTGGAGYIGSHTVVELIESNYDPVIIDNMSNASPEVIDAIEAITGTRPMLEVFDLQDKYRLEDFFECHGDLAAVVHFAAFKAVGESVEKPEKYYRNNLVSLLNLLECMHRFKVPSLVFSSSCTVYGQPEDLPVKESSPIQNANSPYGNTKQISEEIIRDSIAAHQDIAGIALRYFNPVGAHPSGQIGELPRGVPNNLLPFITQTGLGLRESLKVFGGDYNTPDGSCIRDYLHVVDLAKAHVIAIQRLLDNKNLAPFEVFNLGTGKGVSVLEMVHMFEKVSGTKLPYQVVGRRAGDIEQIWADPQRANEELGWKAEISLEEMVASAWQWEQNYTQKHPERT